MGFTRYMRVDKNIDIDQEEYLGALKDIRKIIEASPIPLAGWEGEEGTEPEFDDRISFNGVGGDSCETCSFPLLADQLDDFNFVKTRERPYDLIVSACYARISECNGITVNSDGDYSEGIAFAEKVLGRTLNCANIAS